MSTSPKSTGISLESVLTLYEYTPKENWYEFAALEDHLCRVVEVTQGAVRQPHGRHSQECNEYVGFYRYTEIKPKHKVDIIKIFSVAMFKIDHQLGLE